MSLKAKGLLSLLLSQPDGWKISVERLVEFSIDGKAAVGTAIDELVRAGYIRKEQIHGERGLFTGYNYTVTEKPNDHPFPENRKMDAPFTDFPFTDNREMDTLLDNNINTIPPIAPQGAARKKKAQKGAKEAKKAPDWKPERFEKFWLAYPVGKSKQAAIKAWDKLRPDDALLETMAKALKKQMASAEWQRGIGIPYASTWINQRRWEDEDRAAIQQAPADEPEEDDEREELEAW